jgi:putative NIF3 family GTP cyclohydrolase 1 type 2
MKTIFLTALFFLISITTFSQKSLPKTPEDVIEQIKKNVTCEWSEKTVDTFKAGNKKTELKGITTCMFAEMNVLKEAVQKGCNLIIAHEPVFYNHLDETSSLENNPVYKEKIKFIQDNNLVIFRFHDHIHRTEPDGISKGMIREMDLEQFSLNNSQTFFEIPQTTVKEFAKGLKTKLNLETIRIIGKPELSFTKLAFMAGAPGGQRHIQMLSNPGVEVIIAGEALEWETYQYANDAVQLGKNKAVIFLGHIKSEEAGMKYCADWLKSFINGVPIVFIENQPNFTTL